MNRWQLIQSALLSQDEEVRLSGLQSLASDTGEEGLDLICAALGDDSWRIRKEAVNLFLALPHALAGAERIVALLYDDENAGLRNSAAEILVKLQTPVLPILLTAASSSDHDVRKFVIDILGDRGDHRATPILLHLLQNDPEPNVRAAAAENLGKIGDVTSVPVMVKALTDPDLLVQFSLLEALGRIGSAVSIELLVGLGENRLLRRPLFDTLGRIGDATVIPSLVKGLLDPMRNVREAALLALQSLVFRYGDEVLAGQMNGAALTKVVAFLQSPLLLVQRAALAILGIHCDRAHAVLLASYLDNEELADDVATLLVARGRAVVADLTVCWAEASAKKKAYLAYLFAATGVADAAHLLVEELKVADNFLRTVLFRALGQVGGPETVVILAGYLDVPEDDARQAAVDGLVKVAERFHAPVIDLVRGAFAHVNPLVRQTAVQVLGRLGDDKAEGLLLLAVKDESALVRRSAIYYLDGRNPRHYPALTLALTDEEGDVRRQAIEVLAMRADRALIEPLTLVLHDADPWVRATAVRALGRFGGAAAIAAIRSGLHDAVGLVMIAAVETLAAENLSFDQGEIVKQLGDHDDDVVLALLKFLAQSSDQAWLASWGERLLRHHHAPVRQAVAALLAQGGSKEGLALLQQRLQVEEEEGVRDSLQHCLDCFCTSVKHN